MRTIPVLWFFFIPFCFINLSTNIFFVNGQYCVGHQESSLLHFKNSLLFNPTKSKKLVHWNQSYDCCQWNGITCSKGRVIALDLSEESISGGLDPSSSLFHLQSLQNLNLAYNDFNSVVPSEFKKLKNLRHLNLSNAGFKGQIPESFVSLTNLTTLQLSSCNLSHNVLTGTIPSSHFEGLENLQVVDLGGNSLFGKVPLSLFTLTSLQELMLSYNRFEGLLDEIPNASSSVLEMLDLDLSSNNIHGTIPESFVSLANLTTLQLSNCNLSGVFPRKIFQISNLQILDISDNLDLHGSLPNFPHHGSLQILNISHTSFSGELPNSIHNLRKLSTLDLSNCRFNGTLPSQMSELSKLVHLDLSFNNFTGLLASFNKSKNLTYLSLSNNHLTGEVPLSHFEGFENLQVVDLGANSFYGRVPLSLFTLPSLRNLLLPHNRFEGLLDEFPNASSLALEILDISENNLQGLIPESIFRLTRLTLLQLSSNKFNGTIHLDMMNGMKNLATLDLSHNNLSVDARLRDSHNFSSFPQFNNLMLASCKMRVFPSFLRYQSNLLYLDLSSNQIHGNIPNWIWRLEFLVTLNLSNNFLIDLEGPLRNISSNMFVLDLHSNQLQGSIPIFSKNLIYLDYSSNRFNSIATLDMGNHLSFTYFLSLSNNSFHGKIHESFCNASALRVLDLSDNNFNGTIPDCLTKMSSILRVLNLGGNKLQGRISDTFSTSCALRFLDLNENFLSDGIPRSLANCQNLQVLNLGNNRLIDRFPCFLRNIPTLRVMVLRSNHFYGTLECPNNIGNWKTLQILDVASNDFSGTLPITLLRSWKALMLDEDEAKSEFGHLFFDIYDNATNVDYQKALSFWNKDLALKLAKLIAAEPRFVIDHLFSNALAEDFGGQSFQDSVTIVNKGRQIFQIPNLQVLDISDNQDLHGSLPNFPHHGSLQILNISHTSFSGELPYSIHNLRKLSTLDLSNCRFNGTIPSSISELTHLVHLDLSDNYFTGLLPSFNKSMSLSYLSLFQNDLRGEITSHFEGLENVTTIDLAKSYNSGNSIDWNLLSAELGFCFGLGIVILPLIFWTEWRSKYFKHVDYFLWKNFPHQFSFVYEERGGKQHRILRWK
ncbi:receptor-like protein 7 [Senna tora]|uniref:Receptor-like protein 7 n=1 Tax=Senna tora TaxID=362788 RepID=A0A834XK44_9FABA|nr:receptor-like protein 7 [Senna tora]